MSVSSLKRSDIVGFRKYNSALSGNNSISMGGYFVGGVGSAVTTLTSIDKISFPTNTFSSLSATLPTANADGSGMANSGVAGYNSGGKTTAGTTNGTAAITKMAFAGETISTLAATLAQVIRGAIGFANSGTNGFVFGGEHQSNTYSTIAIISFSDDTRTTGSSSIGSMNSTQAFENAKIAAFIPGGRNSTALQTAIRKYLFAGNVQSTGSATVSVAKQDLQSASNHGVAGYIINGYQSAGGDWFIGTDKLTYSGETRATLATTLSGHRALGSGLADRGKNAFFCFGKNMDAVIYYADVINFPSDTRSMLASPSFTTRNEITSASFANIGTL
jgi:hypothetical protein